MDTPAKDLSGGEKARLLLGLATFTGAQPDDPRRADQPSRHRQPRGAGRGARRIFRRGHPHQPRPASGRGLRRPAVAGRRRHGPVLRRRPRRLRGAGARLPRSGRSRARRRGAAGDGGPARRQKNAASGASSRRRSASASRRPKPRSRSCRRRSRRSTQRLADRSFTSAIRRRRRGSPRPAPTPAKALAAAEERGSPCRSELEPRWRRLTPLRLAFFSQPPRSLCCQ